MSTITELKDKIDTKTMNLVLLGIATAGIYPLLWLYKNNPIIEDATKTRTANEVFFIWMAVCSGLSGLFSRGGNENVTMGVLALILLLAGGVLYVVWAFRTKAALQEYALNEHKVDLRMNGFYTFLFTVYYINYCINDLPEAQRKQKILNNQ